MKGASKFALKCHAAVAIGSNRALPSLGLAKKKGSNFHDLQSIDSRRDLSISAEPHTLLQFCKCSSYRKLAVTEFQQSTVLGEKDSQPSVRQVHKDLDC